MTLLKKHKRTISSSTLCLPLPATLLIQELCSGENRRTLVNPTATRRCDYGPPRKVKKPLRVSLGRWTHNTGTPVTARPKTGHAAVITSFSYNVKAAIKSCCWMGNCAGERTREAETQNVKHLECIKTTSQRGQFSDRFIRRCLPAICPGNVWDCVLLAGYCLHCASLLHRLWAISSTTSGNRLRKVLMYTSTAGLRYNKLSWCILFGFGD